MMKIFSIRVVIKSFIKKVYAFYNKVVQTIQHSQWFSLIAIIALIFALLYLLSLLNISVDFDDRLLLLKH